MNLLCLLCIKILFSFTVPFSCLITVTILILYTNANFYLKIIECFSQSNYCLVRTFKFVYTIRSTVYGKAKIYSAETRYVTVHCWHCTRACAACIHVSCGKNLSIHNMNIISSLKMLLWWCDRCLSIHGTTIYLINIVTKEAEKRVQHNELRWNLYV